MLGNGPVYSVKIGRTSMDVKELVKNVMRGAYSLIGNVLDGKIGPEEVRQINIKTYNSPSLPIYSHLSPEEVKAFHAVVPEMQE